MIHRDTICLLRECDAGIQMGTAAIDDVLGYVQSGGFRECLSTCRRHHEQLGKEIEEALARFEDDGKAPNAIARGMAWMKAHAQLAATPTDAAVASLITDGCNMGVKSLGRYLNEYVAADAPSKDIAKRLIALEEGLAADARHWL